MTRGAFEGKRKRNATQQLKVIKWNELKGLTRKTAKRCHRNLHSQGLCVKVKVNTDHRLIIDIRFKTLKN